VKKMQRLAKTVPAGRDVALSMYNERMATEVIPKLTYEEFRQLPDDGKRYELIHGRVHTYSHDQASVCPAEFIRQPRPLRP